MKGTLASHGVEVSELSTHLQGQLVAVHPAYDELFDAFARKREILQLLSMGLSNQEMADKLVIAEGTLKRHIANLYQKLGVHNRTQAVRHYHQH